MRGGRGAAAVALLALPAILPACRGRGGTPGGSTTVILKSWKGGLAVESATSPPVSAYFWFYEWNLFDAVNVGESTPGSIAWDWTFAPDGKSAEAASEWLTLKATAVPDGADLILTVTNRSDHDWPELAALVPCLSPGLGEAREARFLDEKHERTWYPGADGLARLKAREIHFNRECRDPLGAWDREREDGRLAFSEKWPTSRHAATQGLLVRESDDGNWVMGVGWERFLSAQGHNPMKCMHLSVKVGPLPRGESRTVRGKIYLFRGSRDDCLERFRRDLDAGDA